MEASLHQKASNPWGVIERDGTPEMHVMPTDADGCPLRPHVLSRFCTCWPDADDICPNLVIHYQIQ